MLVYIYFSARGGAVHRECGKRRLQFDVERLLFLAYGHHAGFRHIAAGFDAILMLAVGQCFDVVAAAVAHLQFTVDIHTGVFWLNRECEERAAGILGDHRAHLARCQHHLVGARLVDGAREIVVAQHT